MMLDASGSHIELFSIDRLFSQVYRANQHQNHSYAPNIVKNISNSKKQFFLLTVYFHILLTTGKNVYYE
jgi:hypothetical protein